MKQNHPVFPPFLTYIPVKSLHLTLKLLLLLLAPERRHSQERFQLFTVLNQPLVLLLQFLQLLKEL